MPKVLRIINRLNLGGPTLNVAYLTKYLEPEFETMLLSGQKDETEASSEFIIRDLGLEPQYISSMYRSINPLKDVFAYFEIKRIIKEFKPDVVHTHAAKSGALGRLAASRAGVPVIVHTFHGHVFHSYFGRLKSWVFIQIERYLAKKTTKIVTISAAQRHEIAEIFKIAPLSKFTIVPLGFDLDRFQVNQASKRESFRKEFNVDVETVCIGIIGRLVPIKNHTLFLRALKFLNDNTIKKYCAFIVGDGESRNEIEHLATELGIKHIAVPDVKQQDTQLIFTSWRRDIDFVNAGMDIIALTSLNEGTPVSLIEAQAANRAIVSTKVGGISDIAKEGETALLSDINDEEAFFKNLLRLVEDANLRQKLGENGSEFVMAAFSYQRLVKDIRLLYQQLLSKN
ncbi:MAG: glycosyltransferase [Saprospiraceae bacterium]|nr:glycosyltransferase [Saprospiraceae bacterium]